MLHFPDRPELRNLIGGTWELCHDYGVPCYGATLVVPAGFLTDLASVPKPFRGIIDKTSLGGASVIAHDFLYQHGGRTDGVDLTRRQVDALFDTLMHLERIPAWRRTVAWLAVRVAGWAVWKKAPVRRARLEARRSLRST